MKNKKQEQDWDTPSLTLQDAELPSTAGPSYPLRRLEWHGAPIVDVCAVQAEYGHLLVLTADGKLHGIHADTGTVATLCAVELPVLEPGDVHSHFAAQCHRLHASADGQHAAIVVDQGRDGILVQTTSGAVTLHLNGGDYHEDTVPFSACFLRFEGRNVLIHRTAWNRLDAVDVATGQSLTERYIAPYEAGRPPAHYLDYFHGQLRPSPDGSRLFDDGWVWHPVSIPSTWSVTDWLRSNPWESEDGASLVDLVARDDWTTPACWISERHLALWGLGCWDDEEGEESGQGPGVLIVDATRRKPSSHDLWPMADQVGRVTDLFSDGVRLYVSSEMGTTVWDMARREQIAALPGFAARLLDPARHSLLAFVPDSIQELSLPWPVEK